MPSSRTPAKPTPPALPTPLPNPVVPDRRPKKADDFFVAYSMVDGVIKDFRIYGRKEPAADFALEQEPAWRLVQVAKGDSVPTAIAAKTAKP